MNIIYNMDFVKKMALYILLPILVIVLITIIGLFIYSKKNKNKNKELYNYTMNFYSCLLGIIVVGFLLSVSIGFSYNFTKQLDANNLTSTYQNLYYFIYGFSLIPLLILFYVMIKFTKVVLNKPEKKIIVKEEEIEVL